MGKLIDETGNRYGKWTVLKQAENLRGRQARWLCHCDCGNEHIVGGRELRDGDSQSCGCLRRERAEERMVGQKFGRLTVIQREGINKWGAITWLCECECGNRVVKRGDSLRSDRTKSCGCFQRERSSEANSLPVGEGAFNQILTVMKYRAKRQKHEWQLTKEQACVLLQQPCYYCGTEPNQGSRLSSTHNGAFIYNGLDRVDNSKGYIIDNVVSCCKICNVAKNTQTLEEFKAWLRRAYEHFAKTPDH